MKILTLDIGGTAVKYGLFQNDSLITGQFSVKDADGNENIPESICSFAKEHMPYVIAISAPGPFDFETGTSLMKQKLLSMYGVSLRELLKKAVPCAEVFFVHDLTAFAVGVLKKMPHLLEKSFAATALGTGFGYTVMEKGKVLLSAMQSPLHPMWNRKYLDGIAEDYVSTRAILAQCEKLGFKNDKIKPLADMARAGEESLRKVFFDYGKHFGACIENARVKEGFCEIVIGGQISLSWDLIKEGFESECKIKYSIIDNPKSCALYGLHECAINGKEKYCNICEE